MDEFPLDKYFDAKYLENRRIFTDVLNRWVELLPPGIVDVEQDQTEDGFGYDFNPRNSDGCFLGIIYYGVPADMFRKRHNLDISFDYNLFLIHRHYPMTLEPVLDLLEAVRYGRVKIYCWPLHKLIEIQTPKRTLKYILYYFLPGVDNLYSYFLRIFKIRPSRIITFAPWSSEPSDEQAESDATL
jgi:hypothetical protein